jgi:hypothetical protein
MLFNSLFPDAKSVRMMLALECHASPEHVRATQERQKKLLLAEGYVGRRIVSNAVRTCSFFRRL